MSNFPLRLPADLKAALSEEALKNDRSLTGEIVNRLRASLQKAGPQKAKP